MKTNTVMTRKMGQFEVLQRTSDGMFNATTLLKQWNSIKRQKKDIDDFLNNKATKEYINTIVSRENLNTGNSPYLESRENLNTQNSGYLKSVVKTMRGKNGGTWMHPFLFIDFAMWLNSEYKYDVVKFVHDELIKYRNDAGDAYREMSSAVATIVEKNEMQNVIRHVAKALNHIVFGTHESEIRDKQAEESTMRELFELERKVAGLINEGFITKYSDLMAYLRRLWQNKYQPKVLSA